MNDPRLDAILQAAASRLQVAVSSAVDKLDKQLGPLAMAAANNQQRQTMMNAEQVLGRKAAMLVQCFARDFADRLNQAHRQNTGAGGLHPHSPSAPAHTDWASLSLVDNAEVERGVTADRLGQVLAHDCDGPLEALSAHVAGLLHDASPERNPLRPIAIAKSVLKALADIDCEPDVTEVLSQHIGRILGPELSQAYTHIVSDMRARGVQPQGLQVSRSRGHSTGSGGLGIEVTGPGGLNSEPSGLNTHAGPWAAGQAGQRNPGRYQGTPPPQTIEAHQRAAQALSNMFGVAMPGSSLSGMDNMGTQGHQPHTYANGAMQSPQVQADFQDLLRRISRQQGAVGDWPATLPMGDELAQPAAGRATGSAAAVAAPGFAGPLMATNLIRAHREELVRASGGAALDQMVIDIVAALFDQVLSDPKVAPEMARQIARLQMPVLRVALGDMSFFNSRKHPVRRFVNRIATLSAAFDSHEEGASKACLERVTALVNDIVDGDFDRMDLYEAKLSELEGFIEAENTRESADHAAVTSLLSGKESDLRVQQRYMQMLKRELLDVAMPDFVRDFISQIWSQVQVMASARDGAHSALALRMRKAGHDLALSVQPKGTPQLRKVFLMGLPQLMKDLNEGLALIQWSEEAKQGFYSQLLPAHAESLKTAPHHDLTQRLLEQRLNKVEQLPIPSRDEAAQDTLPMALDDLHAAPMQTVVPALSPEEALQAGFVSEAAVPSEPLDIDLNAADGGDAGLSDIDINLDAPPPPSAGLQLVHHIQKGTPYQMMMQGEWKRVRLTWVSEGRAFFIFTQGHVHKKTISLTSRTLAKMCDTGRFKAFEQAELLERATVRARRQLAALGGKQPSESTA